MAQKPKKVLTPEEAAARAEAKAKEHVRAAQDHAAPVITVVMPDGSRQKLKVRKETEDDNG